MNEAAVHAKLVQLARASLEERLTLIRETFPDVVRDAEQWLSLFFGMPWEDVVLSRDDARADLLATYEVHFGRSHPDDVAPRTALFVATCALLYERELMDRELQGPVA